MLLLLILSPSQPPTTPSIAPMPYMPSAAPKSTTEKPRPCGRNSRRAPSTRRTRSRQGQMTRRSVSDCASRSTPVGLSVSLDQHGPRPASVNSRGMTMAATTATVRSRLSRTHRTTPTRNLSSFRAECREPAPGTRPNRKTSASRPWRRRVARRNTLPCTRRQHRPAAPYRAPRVIVSGRLKSGHVSFADYPSLARDLRGELPQRFKFRISNRATLADSGDGIGFHFRHL